MIEDLEPYKIKKWPDEILRRVADPIPLDESGFGFLRDGSGLDIMLERMWVTLKELSGYGLAAPQIGSSSRVIIVHIPGGCKIELINPEIVKQWGGRFMSDEGCLSYPGRRVRVLRHRQIKVKGLDRYGEPVAFGGKNLQAACLQHEIEHLDGINLANYDDGRQKT